MLIFWKDEIFLKVIFYFKKFAGFVCLIRSRNKLQTLRHNINTWHVYSLHGSLRCPQNSLGRLHQHWSPPNYVGPWALTILSPHPMPKLGPLIPLSSRLVRPKRIKELPDSVKIAMDKAKKYKQNKGVAVSETTQGNK